MNNPAHVSLNRVLKCGISLAVFAGFNVRTFLMRLVGRVPNGSCVVIYYHSVPGSERQRFANQLDRLCQYTNPVAVNGNVTLMAGMRYAAITFDDGFENFYQHALPELVKRRVPAAVFIISDAIGKSFGVEGCAEKVMSLEQIRALPNDLVVVGSHTLSHPLLPSLSTNDATREIVVSRAQLEKQLDRKVSLFSFPFGGFNQELIEICRGAGYQRIFSTLPQFGFKSRNEFVTGRVRVDPSDWELEFRLKLAGAYGWLPWVFEFKRKVVTNVFVKKMWRRQLGTAAASRSTIQP